MGVLPTDSPARLSLHRALRGDAGDMAAVHDLCVPWVTDPASMLTAETARVRLDVFKRVAAYLLSVGASLAASDVPRAHARLLGLPRSARLARFCSALPNSAPAEDSDDEAWLRDDLPSARWRSGPGECGVPGVAHDRVHACVAANTTAHGRPSPPPPSAPVGPVPSGVHEADAIAQG